MVRLVKKIFYKIYVYDVKNEKGKYDYRYSRV